MTAALSGKEKKCVHTPFLFMNSDVDSVDLLSSFLQEVQSQVERICEMGQVMRRAVQVDDQNYCSIRERLAQLEVNTVHHGKINILFSAHSLWKCYWLGFLVGDMRRLTQTE